ncbi:GNAT family N-acetyltransferase [Providencia sp. wls1943]|uniref:GNAT family N-acetyltransferase n=1 Tax=unclassified Providencia TaxID=2633465 RepID=UPI0012B62649|nr:MULTISPECIES: GNAT family N-acetyltransferase [unclassified Providencia]MTB68476.1 GNAT family N-acetyltransferase [Providencia sp. wls1943]
MSSINDMYSIRLATQEDAQFLPEVEASAGQTFAGHPKFDWIAQGEVQPLENHVECIANGLEWLAVDHHDQPVGFIMAEHLSDSLHIVELSVQQSAQGQGLGKQLIQQVIEFAQSQQIGQVTLTTFRDIPWNAPYYQRLGFSIMEETQLTSELQDILQHEVDAGFQKIDRCAMLLNVN